MNTLTDQQKQVVTQWRASKMVNDASFDMYIGVLVPYIEKYQAGSFKENDEAQFLELFKQFDDFRSKRAQFLSRKMDAYVQANILPSFDRDNKTDDERQEIDKRRAKIRILKEIYQKIMGIPEDFDNVDFNPIVQAQRMHRRLVVSLSTLSLDIYIPGGQDNEQFAKLISDQQIQMKQSQRRVKEKFLPEHDEFLIEMQKSQKSYKQIAVLLNSKFNTNFDEKQCQQRFSRTLQNVHKGRWSQNEDDLLLQLCQQYNGSIDLISQHYKQRHRTQILERLKLLQRNGKIVNEYEIQ